MTNVLGKNIANQRHRVHLTQEQLAELSDMTINYLSKIERGVVKQISSGSLYRIASALNVSMEDLMEGHTVDTKPQPNRKLLQRELSLLNSKQSEEYCKLFVGLIKAGHEAD